MKKGIRDACCTADITGRGIVFGVSMSAFAEFLGDILRICVGLVFMLFSTVDWAFLIPHFIRGPIFA